MSRLVAILLTCILSGLLAVLFIWPRRHHDCQDDPEDFLGI